MRTQRHFGGILFCPACLILIVMQNFAIAGPEVVLDAAYEDVNLPPGRTSYYFSARREVGQTFTVGTQGVLNRIDLLAGSSSTFAAPDPLILNIYETLNGMPERLVTSAMIPNEIVPYNDVLGWASFDISSANVFVHPGDVFAITLTTTGAGQYRWAATSSDWTSDRLYQGGIAIHRGDFNGNVWAIDSMGKYSRGFRTYVAVPEPNALLLATLGFTSLIVWRRSRRRP